MITNVTKRFWRFAFILLSIMPCAVGLKAQSKEADSINRILSGRKLPDTSRALLMLRLANAYEQVSPDSVRAMAERALRLSIVNSFDKGAAGAYEMIGAALSGKGSYDSAISYFQKSLQVARKAGLRDILSSKYNYLANVYFKKAKYAEASIYYDSAARLAAVSGNVEIKAKSLSNRANVYYTMGSYTKALDLYLQGLKVQEELGKKLNIASDVSNIANVYMRLGQYDKAIAYVNRGLQLYGEAGVNEHILGCLTTYAIIYNERKMYDSSLHYLLRASALANELQNPYLQNILNGNLAECYMKMGNTEKAMELYSQSVEVSQKLDDAEGLGIAKAGLGELYVKKGNHTEGQRYLKEALSILTQLGIKEQAVAVAEKLAKSYEQTGDYKTALQYYKTESALQDSLQKDQSRRDAAQLLFGYEMQKKEDKIKLLQQENALEQSRNSRKTAMVLMLGLGLVLAVFAMYLVLRNLKNERKALKIIRTQKEEIELQTHKLHELNQFKDNTFSILSHDLRSPVNALTSTMMLLDENLITPQEFALYKQELNEKLQSVSILLDNMLYWAQSQMKGELTLEIMKLNLRQKVQSTFLILADAAKQKSISLHNTVAADIVGFADKDQLNIVIRNLVSNAIKFTHRSGEVVVSATRNGAMVELTVADNGVGMTPEQIAKLFDHTEHASTRGTGGEKGTGLGLQLCYDIMQRNHGNLRVSSTPGLGSIFTIIIPTEQPE